MPTEADGLHRRASRLGGFAIVLPVRPRSNSRELRSSEMKSARLPVPARANSTSPEKTRRILATGEEAPHAIGVGAH